MQNINDNKYHYFYKITNLINNHFYYGVHNTDNLDDGYMGSGKRLHYAYKKYGTENFSKEIIKFFDSTKEAFDYEEQIVNETLVKDANCYNCCNGGINPKLLSNESKNKKRTTYKEHQHQKGKNNSQYGTCWINNGTENKKIKIEELENYINIGWIRGQYFKHRKSKSNLRIIKDRKVKFIQHKVTNEIKCILINDSFDDNWEQIKMHDAKLRTKLSKELLGFSQKGKNNSQYGTKWINNEIEEKTVNNDEINNYINSGWKLGRLKDVWINNSIINTRIIQSKLEEYLKNGWKKGKIKRNN